MSVALKLGDTITVQCSYDAGGYPDVSLKIVGIYEVAMDNGDADNHNADNQPCHHVLHSSQGGRHGFIGGIVNRQLEAVPVQV